MDLTALYRIEAGSINAGVSQNIRQPGNVFLKSIVGAGEQMPQIMWKHFFLRHFRVLTKRFHLSPDIRPVKRLSVSCDKHCSGSDFLFLEVVKQQLS